MGGFSGRFGGNASRRWLYPAAILTGLFISGAVYAEDMPKDVPEDHWAYKAVQSLVSKGYLGLAQDGSFQGTKSVDRYTLADVVYRILNEVRSGRAGSSSDDVELLRKLSVELRDDLVTLNKKYMSSSDATAQDIRKLREADVVIQEDITRLASQFSASNRQMAAQAQEFSKYRVEADAILKSLSADTKAVDGRVQALRTDVYGDLGKLDVRVADIARTMEQDKASERQFLLKELDGTKQRIDGLKADLASMDKRISGLDSGLASRYDQLMKAINDVSAKADGISVNSGTGIDTLKETIRGLRADLDKVAPTLADITAGVGTLANKANSIESARGRDAAEAKVGLDKLSSELGSISGRLLSVTQDTKTRISSLDDRLSKEEAATTALKGRVDGVEANLKDALQNQLVTVKGDMRSSLDGVNAGLEAQGKELKASINGLDTKIKETQGSLVQAKGSLAQKDEELAAGIRQLRADLDSKTDGVQKASDGKLTEASKGLQDSIKALGSRVDTLSTGTASGIAALQAADKETNSRIDGLSATVTAKDAELDGRIRTLAKTHEDDTKALVAKDAEIIGKLQGTESALRGELTKQAQAMDAVLKASDRTGAERDAGLAAKVTALDKENADRDNAILTQLQGTEATLRSELAKQAQTAEAAVKATDKASVERDNALLAQLQGTEATLRSELAKQAQAADAALKATDKASADRDNALDAQLQGTQAAFRSELAKQAQALDAALKASDKTNADSGNALKAKLQDTEAALRGELAKQAQASDAALKAADKASNDRDTALQVKLQDTEVALRGELDKRAQALDEAVRSADKASTEGDAGLSARISALDKAQQDADKALLDKYTELAGKLAELVEKQNFEIAQRDRMIKSLEERLDASDKRIAEVEADNKSLLELIAQLGLSLDDQRKKTEAGLDTVSKELGDKVGQTGDGLNKQGQYIDDLKGKVNVLTMALGAVGMLGLYSAVK